MAGFELSLSFLDSKAETPQDARASLVRHLKRISTEEDWAEMLVSIATTAPARPLTHIKLRP